MGINLRLSASSNGTRNVYDLYRNMVVDYGADNTGVGSVVNDFYSELKPDMLDKSVQLTIPPGDYNFASFGGVSWINGVNRLDVLAEGASLFGSLFLMTQHMSQIGIDEPAGKSARVKTLNPGAITIELTTESASAGHISRFAVGRYIMITGWDVQGEFRSPYGFPPNFQWVEFRKVIDITGNFLTIDSPLIYFYDQNWIENHRGSAFEADGGGPATIFDLNSGWDADITFNEGTYNAGGLINCCGRNFTMNGGASVGEPIFPSVNYSWRAVNHSAPDARCEIDKLIEVSEFTGGDWYRIQAQSSSGRLLKINGGAVVGNIDGTVKNTEIDNITVLGGLRISPTSYGKGDTFVCTNSTIDGDIVGGLLCKGPNDGTGEDKGYQGIITDITSGVFTIPKCFGPVVGRCFMPDPEGVIMWSGSRGKFDKFSVLSVSQDSWPALDDQTSTTNVTLTNGSKNIAVSSNIFSAGDVGKLIAIPNGQQFGTLHSYITGYVDPQNITIYHTINVTTSTTSKTLQWGTCNAYIHTDWAGGLPNSNFWPTGFLSLYVPPGRSVRFENCVAPSSTADQQARLADYCQSAAWDRPLWEYSKRTYNGSTGATGAPGAPILGKIISIKVNVTKAYTGAGTLNMGFSQHDNTFLAPVGGSDYFTYGPRFNLKVTGERVIQIGSTTGAQSGDTNLNLSTDMWIDATPGASMSRDISAENSADWPSFTIEWVTDQGFA